MDFEDGVDQSPIRSTIPGMEFTTTMGYDWIYGDIRTGQYNVNPYGSRSYECHGNIFAWLGPNQGSGRIDFTGATAESIGMLTSTATGTYLDAYDSSGTLLARSFAGGNTGTGTMSEMRVAASNIAYVIVHDTGNYWLIDDLRVSDLLRETSAFQSQDSSSVFQTLDLIDSGAFFNIRIHEQSTAEPKDTTQLERQQALVFKCPDQMEQCLLRRNLRTPQ